MAERVGDLLNNIFPKEHQWKIKLFQNWKEIIGSLEDKVRIEQLNDNTIVLGVYHPAWAQELLMLSNIIKQKINAILKENRIKKIKFRVVEFQKTKLVKVENSREYKAFIDKNKIKTIAFNPEERTSLDKIKNEDLKLSLKEYYFCCRLSKKEILSEKSVLRKKLK